jgi:hypothetical protein
MHDNNFDTFISQMVQAEPVISMHQKRVAYARLMERVAQEYILPPKETETLPTPQRSRILDYSERFWRWLNSVMVDEAHYERARQYRLAYPLWNPCFGESGLPIRLCEPVRYRLGMSN